MSKDTAMNENAYESTILEQISALTIGSVESVAPDAYNLFAPRRHRNGLWLLCAQCGRQLQPSL